MNGPESCGSTIREQVNEIIYLLSHYGLPVSGLVGY